MQIWNALRLNKIWKNYLPADLIMKAFQAKEKWYQMEIQILINNNNKKNP